MIVILQNESNLKLSIQPFICLKFDTIILSPLQSVFSMENDFTSLHDRLLFGIFTLSSGYWINLFSPGKGKESFELSRLSSIFYITYGNFGGDEKRQLFIVCKCKSNIH